MRTGSPGWLMSFSTITSTSTWIFKRNISMKNNCLVKVLGVVVHHMLLMLSKGGGGGLN